VSEKSSIEWTDATFNPWWGCAKVSPGCDNCYAERDAARYQPNRKLWGSDAERRFFGEEHWMLPLRWDRRAAREGRRLRVFCASMADVFDNHEDLPLVREMLWDLIRRTPHLDWLILTKRIGNARSMLPADWGGGYSNVWLGASVVNQFEADRDIPKLVQLSAARRFLSCEPLLGPIDLSSHLGIWWNSTMRCWESTGSAINRDAWGGRRLDWVIIGGESGPNARSMTIGWAKEIVAACRGAAVAPFVQQLGARPVNREGELHKVGDRKGGNMAEWP